MSGPKVKFKLSKCSLVCYGFSGLELGDRAAVQTQKHPSSYKYIVSFKCILLSYLCNVIVSFKCIVSSYLRRNVISSRDATNMTSHARRFPRKRQLEKACYPGVCCNYRPNSPACTETLSSQDSEQTSNLQFNLHASSCYAHRWTMDTESASARLTK